MRSQEFFTYPQILELKHQSFLINFSILCYFQYLYRFFQEKQHAVYLSDFFS